MRTHLRVILIGLSIVLGAFGGLVANSARVAAWRPLGRPPETPQKIVTMSFEWVALQTTSGQAYAFQDNVNSVLRGGDPQGEWLTTIPSNAGWPVEDCQRNLPVGASRLPLAVKDSLTCWIPIEQGRIGFTYAVLTDGSVWRWTTPTEVDRWYAPLCLSLLGAGAGLLAMNLLLKLARSGPLNAGWAI